MFVRTVLIALALLLAACTDGPKAPTLPGQVFNICEERRDTVSTTFTNENNCNKNNVAASEEEEEEDAVVVE